MDELIKKYINQDRSWLNRYGFSLLLLIISFSIIHFISSIEQVKVSSIILGAAVLSAIHGGLGPALMVSLLGALGLDFFHVSPIFMIFDSLNSFLRIFIFSAGALLVSSLVALLRSSLIETENYKTNLKQSNQETNNLMTIVAHDLRNPIGSIKGFADLLLETNTKNPEFIDRISKSASFCLELIEDLQEFSSFKHSNFTTDFSRFDFDRAINEVVSAATPLAQKKNINIKFNCPPGSYELEADKTLLRRAIQNILDNAIKYSPLDSLITIELEPQDTQFKLTVTDQGMGINDDEISKIFTPFYKAQNRPTNGESSTGLGLASVAAIIKIHKGDIKVISQPEQGSAFTIYLPANSATSTTISSLDH